MTESVPAACSVSAFRGRFRLRPSVGTLIVTAAALASGLVGGAERAAAQPLIGEPALPPVKTPTIRPLAGLTGPLGAPAVAPPPVPALPIGSDVDIELSEPVQPAATARPAEPAGVTPLPLTMPSVSGVGEPVLNVPAGTGAGVLVGGNDGDPGEPVGGERSDFGRLDAVLGTSSAMSGGAGAAATLTIEVDGPEPTALAATTDTPAPPVAPSVPTPPDGADPSVAAPREPTEADDTTETADTAEADDPTVPTGGADAELPTISGLTPPGPPRRSDAGGAVPWPTLTFVDPAGPAAPGDATAETDRTDRLGPLLAGGETGADMADGVSDDPATTDEARDGAAAAGSPSVGPPLAGTGTGPTVRAIDGPAASGTVAPVTPWRSGDATVPTVRSTDPFAGGARPATIPGRLDDAGATPLTATAGTVSTGAGGGAVVGSTPPAATPAMASEPTLTSAETALRDRIRRTVEFYRQRPEVAAGRSPWGVMHSFLPYGVNAEVIVGNQRLNAIGYLCWNGACRGMRLFTADARGNLGVRVGAGYQGHEGQFLAMLAQCRVDPRYELRVDRRPRTIRDLIAYEQATCVPKTELTFKLIGLAHYVGTDATWTNRYGTWNVERLLREELAQPINGVACGGTHRLMGIAFAVQQRRLEGRPIDGAFATAQDYIARYHRYTFSLQNADGTFSTNWFESRGLDRDLDRQVQTTGHILEWLIYTLPVEQLRDPRIVRSVWWLLTTMERGANYKWEVGPKGHAIRALVLYDRFVFGGTVGGATRQTARVPADR